MGVADGFNKSQARVVANPPLVTGNFNQELLIELAGGTPPDVFWYLQENIPIPALVAKNIGYPLDAYISRDKYDPTDYLPQALALNVWQGKMYALPRDYGSQQIFYNVDLFQSAGIPPIPADWSDTTWTFAAYLAAAQKLTKQEGGKTTVWGCLINRAWRPWATFVYSNGGAVVNQDANGEATSIALDSSAATEAMQFLQDMIYKHKVAPPPAIEGQEGSLQLFASSRVGMIVDNPNLVGNYRKSLKFKWDVGAMPLGHATKRGTGGGGTAWAITAQSKQHDAAWQFLQWLCNAESERVAARAGITTPARISILHSPDFLHPGQSPEHSNSFVSADDYVVRDPVSVNWPQIQEEVVNKDMDSLWDDSKDAKALATMIKQQAASMFKS